MNLITTKNLKTEKGSAKGYFTGILMLAPFTLSGKNVCPKASQGCAKACLNTSGHGRYQFVQNARIRRTLMFFNDRGNFKTLLKNDIKAIVRRSKKNEVKPAIRINGTSDLPALAIEMAREFPEVPFYDYTKIIKTLERQDLPANYHVTFSRSENNQKDVERALELGFNVSVVFEKLPKTYLGRKVIDGDKTDLRFLDKKGVIVGLSAKGRAKKDTSGFVVRNSN